MKIENFIFICTLSFCFLFTTNVFAMHISEGILPIEWAGLWYLVALPFIIKAIIDIKKISKENYSFKPLLGLMAASVFVISCMPVPVPFIGTCSHPCGTGMAAILLGPIISIFVSSIALLIQALFLAHGGISTWGANIVSMGVAGSFTGYLVFKILRKFNTSLFISGFSAGLLADWATYTATSFELAAALHGDKSILFLFTKILLAFIPTQLPLGIIEGFLTGGMIVFIYNRRPDILISLNVVKGNDENFKKEINKKFIIFTAIFFLLNHKILLAENKWSGVDESVVEKVAEENGRKACTPFINTDQGDLLLFVFLIAGAIGGFIMGYYWRKLFGEKDNKNV
ncbi:energy-coupling factor ABC transporter permease [Candidatus Poribacteria bacterium]|nr:energy-coupling factor ABC transporter permease [Candidatus Poribacteria bacterium]